MFWNEKAESRSFKGTEESSGWASEPTTPSERLNMSRQLFFHYHQLPFMYQGHNILLNVSQNSSAISGLPHSRPPIPGLFTGIGDREDSYDKLHHSSHHHTLDLSDIDQKVSQQLLAADKTHNGSSSAAPYDGLPPLSPIFPSSMSPAAMFLSAFSPAVSNAPLPDDEGEEVEGYKLGSIIGYGGFSTIRRAFSPSGGTVAVKIVRRSDLASQANPTQARDRMDNEGSIWKTLSHEHILPLFHFAHTPYADFFFMLLCPAGTLYDILKRDGHPALPLDDAGTMFRQVVRGVRYLHEQMGLVHADLKLENVLVDEMGVCRITDFGMTRSVAEEFDEDPPAPQTAPRQVRDQYSALDSFRSPRSLLRGRGSLKATGHLSLLHHRSRPRRRESTPVSTQAHPQTPQSHAVYEFPPGSLPYAAPELLHAPDADHVYRPDPAQDIWALGVMLYALLTGGLPFVDSFEPRLTMKILRGTVPSPILAEIDLLTDSRLGAFEMPKNVGRGAELVLRGCLESSVTQRWTIAAVDDVSWSVGWDSDTNDSCSGLAECEPERMAHDMRTCGQGPASRSASCAHSVVSERLASEDALPELEDDAEPMHRSIARSTSSRSRSTGTGPFSPFTNTWSEIGTPSVGLPELHLPLPGTLTLTRPSPERLRGRHASKDSVSGRRSSAGLARSTSPSVEPISPTSAEMRGRKRMGGPSEQSLPTPVLDLSKERPKRAGSQPARHSAPWAVPSRVRATVGISPALSVAFPMSHDGYGSVLKTGTCNVRSRSVERA